MKYSKINDKLTVAPQICADDIVQIKTLGCGTIICNRPDGEAPDQTEFAAIEAAAKAAGLDIIHQPITPPTLNLTSAKEFAQLVQSADAPVFAYCRTGTRCITLWALSERENGADIDDLIEFCGELGYGIAAPLQNIR